MMSTGEERLNGITDWEFGQGISFGPSGSSLDTGIDLGLAATSGAAGGSWSMNPDALTSFSHLLMILRSGETFFNYLFDGPSPDGAWTNTDGQSVDKVLVFVSSSGSPATDSPSAVPLPASLAFLFGGLGALGLIARRRRVAVAA